MRPVPRLYLGTMTFAWSQTSSFVDESTAIEMVKDFVAHNEKYGIHKHRIDTARIYAGGKSESMLGHVLSNVKNEEIVIGSKAHPTQKGGLSADGLKLQFYESLDRMQLNKMEEYYLHQPDAENSLLESLSYLHKLVNDGVVLSIGMSNYHASEMKRAFDLCKQHGLTPPTVYQGLYNPLNRAVEDELLPLLKENKCSFVAYNPLAAGLLAGKHTDLHNVQNGRFKDNQNYLPRFYTQENFEAVELIRKACEEEETSMVEAAYRWLLCHSQLGENDGVLLGASSCTQLEENLDAASAAREKEPLPQRILDAFEQAWQLTKKGAFPYWRSYSSDMPGREALDSGACYEAQKK